MKTITIRLRDLEADALDRLSFVLGLSKNSLINNLIASEYNNFIHGEETTPADAEIYYIGMDADFADDYIECNDIDEENMRSTSERDLKRIVKCYDYAIEKADEQKAAELMSARSEFVDALIF